MASRSLKALRERIDEIDKNLLELLSERAKVVIEVGSLKEKSETPYDPQRESLIFERLQKENPGPLPNEALRAVFREVISASRSLERRLNIAFFGPEATFTHMAAIRRFGQSATFVPCRDIEEVFESVAKGRVDYGVVPVENSTEGVVSRTLDMFIDFDLKICAEVLLEINHHLLSMEGKIDSIERVYSHPQVLAQCKDWLKNNLPAVEILEASSTAAAAKQAREDLCCAAIASEEAAILYDIKMVEQKIQDHMGNFTRFLVIGNQVAERTGKDKTFIMFSVKDEVGILYRMLKSFSKHGINLFHIESRPLRGRAWEYLFFVELEGHLSDEGMKSALKEVESGSLLMKVLGSYPQEIQ